MNLLRLLVALIVGAISINCAAQSGTVGFCPNGPSNLILYWPTTSSDLVWITVTTSDESREITASSVEAQVHGNIIDVTLFGVLPPQGLPPIHPAACGSVRVGPLRSGHYTVNYLRSLNGATPTLQNSAALDVIDVVPANTPIGLAILVLLLSAAAFVALRRVAHRR